MTATQIQRLRKRLGLTQVQLAAKLGVSQTAVSFWEAGLATPRKRSIADLKKLQERTRHGSRRA